MAHKKYTLYNTHNIISIEVEDTKRNLDYTFKKEVKVFGMVLRKEGYYDHGYILDIDNATPFYEKDGEIWERASAWVNMSNDDYFIIYGKNLEDVKRKVKNMLNSNNKMHYHTK